jgi:hypothetical protein
MTATQLRNKRKRAAEKKKAAEMKVGAETAKEAEHEVVLPLRPAEPRYVAPGRNGASWCPLRKGLFKS